MQQRSKKENKMKTIKEKVAAIIKMGGKEWSQHGKSRVYFNCEVYNKLLEESEMYPVSLSEGKNKFFFDEDENAVMRSYKNKKPTISIQY